ncbi:MAG: YggT family protein [Hydrogenobacter sp.]|uniref:YggT family protein n=1 Tax=Hydrogenobacter thermophilus TaxID=940 RepID=UPI0030FB1722
MIKGFLSLILNLLIILVIFHAIASWFPSLRRSKLYEYTDRLVSPMLEPIRSVIKPINGLDFSPMILLFLIYIIKYLLRL